MSCYSCRMTPCVCGASADSPSYWKDKEKEKEDYCALQRRCEELEAEGQRLREDAERYRWLRDRMDVRKEVPMAGPKRDAFQMRIGHSFVDSTTDPGHGWTDSKYWDEARRRVDKAIDAALHAGGEKKE